MRAAGLASLGRVISIVAGPAGSGKTTTGKMLAGRLNWTFADPRRARMLLIMIMVYRGGVGGSEKRP
jgi:flagellar biosynthesis GTPase FlhF